MGRIKINQTTVCGKEYFNTEEESIAEMKANAETWLEYEIEEAKVEKYWNGEPVEVIE